MNDPLIPIVSTELPFTVQPKIRGVDMDFSDESLVDKHNPDFSVKGWFLLKFLYKVYYSSPAVSRSITGYYVSHIEETPKKQ